MSDLLFSESVISAIGEALSKISVSAGQSFTPDRVVRQDRRENIFGRPPAIQVERVGEEKITSELMDAWSVTLTVEILISLYQAETDLTPTDVLISRACKDVETAISRLDWKALRAELRSIESAPHIEVQETGAHDGALVTLAVGYTSPRADLTTSIDPE